MHTCLWLCGKDIIMGREKVYECDLHTHTKRSDGNDTYEELIARAVSRGVRVVAITDHDVRPQKNIVRGGEVISVEQYGREHHIVVLPGIEFSCNTETEDVHVIGLCCDFSSKKFIEQEEKIEQSKIKGYNELCKRLSQDGMLISVEEIIEEDLNGKAIGELQKKHIFEAMAQKGYVKDWQSAKLLVKNTPHYQIKRKKPHAEEIIRLIKKSGGIAILAHPYLISERVIWKERELSREKYIDMLIESGLGGIEASYTYDKTSYDGKLTQEQIEHEVKTLYKSRVPFMSGGSDYHHDSLKGVKNAREIGERGISLTEFKDSPIYRYLSFPEWL